MSSQVGEKKKGPLLLKQTKTKIIKGANPDEQTPGELGTNLTTAVYTPAAGPRPAFAAPAPAPAAAVAAATSQRAAGPRMFGQTVKSASASALAPAPAAPRKNTTVRANRPRAAINTRQAVVAAPVRVAQEKVFLSDLEDSVPAPCRRDKDALRSVNGDEDEDENDKVLQKQKQTQPQPQPKLTRKAGISSITKQAALIKAAASSTQDSRLAKIETAITTSTAQDPYKETKVTPYYPQDRKGFTLNVSSRFKKFTLPNTFGKIDRDACSKLDLKTYLYQEFIREYMRQASPYRGILVYHGLGSGKTCTAIAASEALYAQDNKKIIVMTPTSLKENFLNEIMFCGFRHFRLNNVWRSFDLTNPANRLFAESVAGIPEKYINSILRKTEVDQRVFWMPDLNQPESKSNFKALEDWQRTAIRMQLYEIIQNKFTFIGYTGMTYNELKNIEQNDPTFFDNAIIVVDEVHNLTRLMVGKLDRYYSIKEGEAEAKAKGAEAAFQKRIRSVERAYLFYKFLTEAKNTKIIALSGTPIVNQPTEVGILANILHGYFHSVRDAITSTEDKVIAKATAVLKAHPRVNFYSITKAEGTSSLFFTILDDGYIKSIDESTGELQGIEHVGVEYADPLTIQDLYKSVTKDLNEQGITLIGRPEYKDLPLMPPTVEEFMDNFINPIDLKVKNQVTFVKRMSGLVSYYRGSREELMPRVTIDEQILCPFESALSQNQYTIARIRELEQQESKSKTNPDTLKKSLDLAESENSSYRFRSRAACNFVFPSDIERPYPKKKKDLKKAIGVSKGSVYEGAIDLGEDDAGLAKAAEDEIAKADAEEEVIPDDGKDDVFKVSNAAAEAALAAAVAEAMAAAVAVESKVAGAAEKLKAAEAALAAAAAAAVAGAVAVDQGAADAAAEYVGAAAFDPYRATPAELRRKVAADAVAADAVAADAVAADAAEAASAAAGGKKALSTKTYPEELAEALQTLYDRKDKMFNIDATLPENEQLKTYSSKFAEIITRIKASKGSSLVYSAFKTIEGIGVLGYALEANGFAQIKLKSAANNSFVFTEETENAIRNSPKQPRFIIYSGEQSVRERQTLINIFNCRMDKLPREITKVLTEAGFTDKLAVAAGAGAGAAGAPEGGAAAGGGGGPAPVGNMSGDICRAFMITGAGAEGLSLKNVRTVHIMEPFWNKVRTDQVKGRAVRICSHSDLPWDERTVEVYTYLAILNKKLGIVPALQINDDSESSDQYILKLAETKERVNSSIINEMKAGAVDCMLNKSDNEKSINCFEQAGSINDFLYDPRIDEDIKTTDQTVVVEVAPAVEAKIITYKDVEYLLVVDPMTAKSLLYNKDDIYLKQAIGEIIVHPPPKKKSIKFYS